MFIITSKRLQLLSPFGISKPLKDLQKISIFGSKIFKINKRFYRKANAESLKKNDSNISTEKTNSNDNSSFRDNIIKWAIQNNISNIAFSKLLKVLSENGVKGIPTSSKTLLLAKENEIKVSKIPPGVYTHFGFQKNLKRLILALIEKQIFNRTEISVSVFIDQLPLVKFTNQGLWVILGSVEGFTDNIFFIGAYWGFSKPKSSNLFLSEFVEEAKNLTKNGLEINDATYNVTIKRLICDAPAKYFVLNIKSHLSYSSCVKCNIVGEYKSKKVCFLGKSTPRKDEDFEKNEMYINKKTCLLEIPNFGVVSNITIDYMHLVCLGVVEKLLSIWLNNDRYWINKNSASDVIKTLASTYPCEFLAKPKSFQLFNHWTANTLRQFLLYYGPVVLKNNLKENHYNHFLLLHVACRLLCSEASTENIDCARQLLYHFVESYKNLYKAEQITHNIHGLYHLADECTSHGILDNFSSFPFEKFLEKLKHVIKKNKKKLVPQTVLRESYDKIFNHSLAHLSLGNYSVSKKIQNCKDNNLKNFSHFEKLSLRNFNIIPNSNSDNCVLLKNNKIVEVTGVVKTKEKPEKYYITGKKFCSVSNFHSGSYKSLKLDMFNIGDVSDTVDMWEIDLIYKKGMKVPLQNEEFVFIGLLDKNF